MKKLFLFIAAVSACLSASAQSPVYPKVGSVAPDFTVDMFDGSTLKLSDLRGKVILLNFWATWCPPCRAEFKRVDKEVIERFAGNDFMFLPISRGETIQTVAKFRESNGYSFPMGLDYTSAIFSKYADTGIPRNFVIGKDGKIALVEIGYDADHFDKMLLHIDKLLKP